MVMFPVLSYIVEMNNGTFLFYVNTLINTVKPLMKGLSNFLIYLF
jgi:hypothetical protein